MVNNFWVDKRRERELMKYREEIAKHFKITVSEFLGMGKIERYELLEEYLRKSNSKKKGK